MRKDGPEAVKGNGCAGQAGRSASAIFASTSNSVPQTGDSANPQGGQDRLKRSFIDDAGDMQSIGDARCYRDKVGFLAVEPTHFPSPAFRGRRVLRGRSVFRGFRIFRCFIIVCPQTIQAGKSITWCLPARLGLLPFAPWSLPYPPEKRP